MYKRAGRSGPGGLLAACWIAATMAWAPPCGASGPAVQQGARTESVLPPAASGLAASDPDASDPDAARLLVDPDDEILSEGGTGPTLVAYIDRATPAGSAAIRALAALAGSDPQLRIVLKELPLQSSLGVDMARTAAAARLQGMRAGRLYEASMMIQADMDADPMADQSTGLRDARGYRTAQRAGLDMARLARDRMSATVSDYLHRVRADAFSMGIEATPSFIVGHHALVGYQTPGQLRDMVAMVRADHPR